MGVQVAVAGPGERISAIEQAFELHWRHFGQYPGADLRDDHGVVRFESPLRRLPYNGVIRTRIPDDLEAEAIIDEVVAAYRSRGVPFMWVHLPSDTPADLGQRLAPYGLDLTESVTGMDLDLEGYEPRPNATNARLVDAGIDDTILRDYEELIRNYWSVPEEDRTLIETLNRHWTGARNPGVRLVAYLDDVPVGKLFLNLQQVPAQVSVYGVAVRPEARGRGIARALMDEALIRAREAGAARCVLHSSAMALPMYLGMGFTQRCTIPVYANAPIFGTHHH